MIENKRIDNLLSEIHGKLQRAEITIFRNIGLSENQIEDHQEKNLNVFRDLMNLPEGQEDEGLRIGLLTNRMGIQLSEMIRSEVLVTQKEKNKLENKFGLSKIPQKEIIFQNLSSVSQNHAVENAFVIFTPEEYLLRMDFKNPKQPDIVDIVYSVRLPIDEMSIDEFELITSSLEGDLVAE